MTGLHPVSESVETHILVLNLELAQSLEQGGGQQDADE